MSARPPNAPPGVPPATILPNADRSGVIPKRFLGAAWGGAEGNDLIEDQDNAKIAGDLPDASQKAIFRHDDAGVSHERIEDDCRELVRMLFDQGLARRRIIEGEDDDLVRSPGKPEGRRDRPRPFGGSRFGADGRRETDERMIRDTVVRTLELGDLPLPSERDGGTNGVHDRLGAGVAEADPLD